MSEKKQWKHDLAAALGASYGTINKHLSSGMPTDALLARDWIKQRRTDSLARMAENTRKAWADPNKLKFQKEKKAEWSALKSAGVKDAWKNPDKYSSMRKQSPELVKKRTHMMIGRKRPSSVVAKISEALTGRRLTPEHRAKAMGGLFRYEDLTAEQKLRRNESISKARKAHGGNWGRAARDRSDHASVKRWVIRDPRGVTHEFVNLQSWCRKNEHRFLPDDFPNSKLPLWRRAVGGFNNMQRTDRKGQHTWRGWVLVSVFDGGQDPLSRLTPTLTRH